MRADFVLWDVEQPGNELAYAFGATRCAKVFVKGQLQVRR
jgi:imidazolonepropionase-like amidohydrolase